MAKLTRDELYALVWDRPMTKLAKEFGLSDVALHKICRKHDVPTPPAGYWAKKAHGKPVTNTPLPNKPRADGCHQIIIHEGAGSVESEAAAVARARVHEAIYSEPERVVGQPEDPILLRTIARLSKAKADKSGFVRVEGKNVITVAVRPESASRAQKILELLVSSAQAAGITLVDGDQGVVWNAEGEEVSFDLAEVSDRVEHVPTEAELKAVAKWEAERAAYLKRTGYDYHWGQPYVPKWEERYQGRLAIRLEEVRIRTENEYWGPTIRGKFADAKNRDLIKSIPKIVSNIAAIAVAKRENREADERRRLAREEAERHRAEAERRAELERKRSATLEMLMAEYEEAVRLEGYLLS
ncbi:MAG: hypothetical protein ACOY4C_11965, partial [Pseudomonadota bacterium]